MRLRRGGELRCPLCGEFVKVEEVGAHVVTDHCGSGATLWTCPCGLQACSRNEIAAHCLALDHNVGEVVRNDDAFLRNLAAIQSRIGAGHSPLRPAIPRPPQRLMYESQDTRQSPLMLMYPEERGREEITIKAPTPMRGQYSRTTPARIRQDAYLRERLPDMTPSNRQSSPTEYHCVSTKTYSPPEKESISLPSEYYGNVGDDIELPKESGSKRQNIESPPSPERAVDLLTSRKRRSEDRDGLFDQDSQDLGKTSPITASIDSEGMVRSQCGRCGLGQRMGVKNLGPGLLDHIFTRTHARFPDPVFSCALCTKALRGPTSFFRHKRKVHENKADFILQATATEIIDEFRLSFPEFYPRFGDWVSSIFVPK